MGKERYSLRLYKHHDGDLIFVILNYEDSITKMLHTALKAFINREDIVIRPTKRRTKPLVNDQWSYLKQLVLDDEEDAEVISFLSKLARGAMDTVLKNILRQYLCCPVAEWDFEDPSGYDDYMDNISTLQMRRGVAKEMNQSEQDPVNGDTVDARKDHAEEKNGKTEVEKVPEFRDQEESLDIAQHSPEAGGPDRIKSNDGQDDSEESDDDIFRSFIELG